MSYHIIDALEKDIIKEKTYFEQELQYIYEAEHYDQYRATEVNDIIQFCTKLINKDPESIKQLKKSLVKNGKKKGDQNVDNIYSITFHKYIDSITVALFPSVYEWIEMSFYDLGRYIGNKTRQHYHTEGACREYLYIVVHDDSNYNDKTDAKKLMSFLVQAFQLYIDDEVIKTLLFELLTKHKYLSQDRVLAMIKYLETPTLDGTKEIMRGIVSL